MNELYVTKTEREHITVGDFGSANPVSLEWSWGEPYPKTLVYALYNNRGIGFLFVSDESPVTVSYREMNSPVNRDSCAEVFISPDPSDKEHYLNFEINAAGVLHLQYGDKLERHDITDVDPRIFEIEARIFEGGWELKLFITFDFMRIYFKDISREMYGNLYKCGDRTAFMHRAAWSPIHTERSAFHLPEYFGKIILT